MLRAGIIGCTGIGREHAAGLAGLENVDVVAACDLNAAAAESFRADMSDFWDDITAYTGHTAMLAEQALDVVTVATGDNAHATLVVDAARAGVRGIFCEKPLATSVADADRMIEAVRDSGAVLSVDHTRRWQPLWRRAYERVTQDDAIGPVRCVIGALNGPRAMLFRNGTHLIDALCYLAGSDPEWVFAELERGYEDHTEYRGDGGSDPSLEPSASGYIHFANGVRGFYTGTSKRSAGPKWHFEVMGSEAQIIVDKEATLIRGGKSEIIVAPEAAMSGIPAGVRDLVEALGEGRETRSPMSAAMNVVEVIFGFLESQRLGNTRVDLPVPRDRA